MNTCVMLKSNFISAMSFLLSTGPADQAEEWISLTADERSTIKSQYAAAGISLVVSAFGSSEERQCPFYTLLKASAADNLCDVLSQLLLPASMLLPSPTPWLSGSWIMTWMVCLPPISPFPSTCLC